MLSNALAEAVHISCVVVERDERRTADEEVSRAFEIPTAELVATRIEIVDGVIEDLSERAVRLGENHS